MPKLISFLVSWHFLASSHLPARIAVNDHEPLITRKYAPLVPTLRVLILRPDIR
jgi:hypothetical protein